MPWRPAHQNVGSANWAQRSKRQAIQSPVAPARGIDHRTCTEKRFSIASNSAQPFPAGSSLARASKGQRDKRDERNAADPVRDEEDMQRSGEFDVVQLAHARARLRFRWFRREPISSDALANTLRGRDKRCRK